MYGAVGFGCGIIGQGIANLIMTAKRYGFLSRVCFITFPIQTPCLKDFFFGLFNHISDNWPCGSSNRMIILLNKNLTK